MAKAKKTTSSSSTKNAGSGAQFEAGVAKLMTLAVQMEQQGKAMGLVGLTNEERIHSMRLRTGEPAAITNIFNVVDQNPSLFQSLAARDGGTDEGTVETAPARASLARAQDLGPVVSALQQVLQLMTDDVLASTQTAKELSVPAYAIARNPARVRTGKIKRAANKAEKSAKKAKGTASTAG